ncbi:unnamed protein product [Tetraodon nigroviridis]|uniref:Chromosome 14 SCAF15120, whole genome shotgun sequence n=1 Tax=Tetraodon nigroviridis TaxID=99883 RepID=Q4RF21_TETNG|nr:unnamed protein product [Tetraodon nigroviridis]
MKPLIGGENGITDLRGKILRTIPKVESINLERNAIRFIHPQAFSGAKQLMLLNLYGNYITNLPSRGFKDLLNLRFLMLGQNQISILKADMFLGMRNLSELDLPLNALTILPSNTFKPLIALKVLDLSMNRIQRISPKAFAGLRQLLFLNLDNNRNNELEHLPPDVFSNMAGLSQLALSGNLLKVVDGSMFAHMPGKMSPPPSLFNLPVVPFLSKDGADCVYSTGIYPSELKKLNLHNNPWHCDCHIVSLVQWVQRAKTTLSPRETLKCSGPAGLQGKRFSRLQPHQLLCPV